MADNSKISWTDHTFNPWIGCSSVSPGCKFCYAEAFAKKRLGVMWGNHPRKITAKSTWQKPMTWERKAIKSKTRAKVFCASLADSVCVTQTDEDELDQNVFLSDISYVHQVQNLYFALTGNELKYEEQS